MATILFHEIVFGPIHSRRLGSSLGMNLLPYDGKLCSFDCLYCECGFNKDFKTKTKLPDRANVKAALEDKLIRLIETNTAIDVITFSGNGEPTMHPEFAGIIDDTIELRDKYYPTAKISVLSNAMNIGKKSVIDALRKVDNNILKLDSAKIETVRLVDRPNSPSYIIEKQIELFKQFDGEFILQTMFLRGSDKGIDFDNTTENEVSAWLEAIKASNPREVMIYSLDRETPSKSLIKVPVEELRKIGDRVEEIGYKVVVAG